MSWQPAKDPQPGDALACQAIESVIVPRARDLGGFEVRRALPSPRRQMVGPFIFFDQMGPAEFVLGEGIDVRPHPHIGLATVTYLFDGEIVHRDSLGTLGDDRSRRRSTDDRRRAASCIRSAPAPSAARRPKLFGIQAWVALPRDARGERRRPSCITARTSCRSSPDEGVAARLIAGEPFGASSPVETPIGDDLCRRRPGAGRRAAVRRRLRGARPLHGLTARSRSPATASPGQLLVFKPGDRIAVRRRDTGPHDAARRRPDGRAAPHLVEFRLLP